MVSRIEQRIRGLHRIQKKIIEECRKKGLKGIEKCIYYNERLHELYVYAKRR